MKKMSFLTRFSLVGLTGLTLLTACGQAGGASSTINVVSREEGSGTRGAFIELFDVLEKNASGEKVDQTTDKAMITNSTAVMLTTVSGDASAIGYVSMGSLDDAVKAVAIDGVKPSVDAIKDGSYKISRTFNLVTKDQLSDAAQDFMSYLNSQEGQGVVETAGYIALETTETYTARVNTGKVVVSGSSSVTPIMEKLKEAYNKINPNVTIEIQQSDSSTGIMNAIDGTADIGMASRDLKTEELQQGITPTPIAMDGIVVIVHKENSLDNLSREQVKTIFTGETSSWDTLAN